MLAAVAEVCEGCEGCSETIVLDYGDLLFLD